MTFEEIPSIPAIETPATFSEELRRQCKLAVVPTALTAICSWLPYIMLDKALFPQYPAIVSFRWGLCLMGLLSLVLYVAPFFKKKYLLLFMIMWYLAISTAVILGLVAADPVYMGGFAIIVQLVPIMPLSKRHALIMLTTSLLIFTVMANWVHMDFHSAAEQYGLLDLILAVLFTVIAVFLLDYIRRHTYEKSLLIQTRNLEIHKQNAELEKAFEEIKTLGGLLPICANCKSIRDNEGYWHQLEKYIEAHTGAEFSHSLCEDCFKRLYPAMQDEADGES
ncbi:MAG: hypothetical protein GY765_00095 [bacterium]|nr:hypothetical protein [bacterium]